MSQSKEYRLVVVGPPVVGKSALTIRLTQSEFANEYDPTIEDSYRYYCTINNVNASLDILDTAGQEEYSSMRDLYMKTGEGFLLVFSLTDRNTFEEISTFYNQIMRVKGETTNFTPMILVGNKSDLIDERQVGKDEAILLASRLNCAYIETSAKDGINITEAFHGLVKIIMNQGFKYAGLENTLYPDPRQEAKELSSNQNLLKNNNNNSNAGNSSGNNNSNLSSNKNNRQGPAGGNLSSSLDNSDDANNNSRKNDKKNTTKDSGAGTGRNSKGESSGCCTIM